MTEPGRSSNSQKKLQNANARTSFRQRSEPKARSRRVALKTHMTRGSVKFVAVRAYFDENFSEFHEIS